MISNSNDMFDNEKPAPDVKSTICWQLVTNQRNLFYMLAAGMIIPPAAFNRKYYQDTLSAFPGWIPLFANHPFKAAIEHSISEREHLMPCLVTVELGSMRGRVRTIGVNGKVGEAIFPDEIDGKVRLILVPAPLPVSWIMSVGFRSGKEKSNCELDAGDFENVPLREFKLKAASSTFKKADNGTWPPAIPNFPGLGSTLDTPLAAGAMMAMLLRMANRGTIAMVSNKMAFSSNDGREELVSNPMIGGLGAWIQAGRAPEDGDVSRKLFWGMVDTIAACRASEGMDAPLDAALEQLVTSSEMLDARTKLAVAKLTTDLKALSRFSDSTITEILERPRKPFSRAMVLFFLRDNCADFLEYTHPSLTEEDYVAAAILFAARDGWLGLPLHLRDIPGLHAAVTHRMAAMAHRIANTGIDLGAPPPRPMSLRELLLPGDRGWNKTQKEAALLLTRECKWDCVQTRVTLGKGEYQLVVDGAGAHVIISGEAKAVTTEVDRAQLFARLAMTPISSKLDGRLHKLLKE